MANKGYILTVICGVTLLIFFSCREKVTEPHTQSIQLSVEDVGVTEVWLHLQAAPYAEPTVLTLLRDNQPIFSTLQTKLDTLLLDDSLLPNHTYHYTISGVMNFHVLESMSISVHTMDTTSHNFAWEIDTLGDGNSSVLHDVALINDTLAYAVGEIYVKDSMGQFEPLYNAVRWNGKEWKKLRVPFRLDYGTAVFIDSTIPITSVFAPTPNDIWFSNGAVTRLVDDSWFMMNFLLADGPGRSNKIWGTSSDNLYFVADLGRITHYNGSSWRKLESGTELALADVYGSPDFMVIAGVNMSAVKGIILKSNGTSWQTIGEGDIITSNELFKPKLYGSITSAWIDEKNTIYAGGNLFYKYQFEKWSYVTSLPENYIGGNPNVYYRGFIHKIRGNKSNDFWIVGDRNTIRHCNGVSWQQIGLPYDPTSDIIWRSVDVNNDFCVAVGDGENKAICIRIKR